MNTNTLQRALRALALGALIPFTGLATAQAQELKQVNIGSTGSTCQAPVFIAHELGFFEEEGLKANFVLGDWNFLREGLAFGRIDAAQGLVMNFLKPLEQGFDVYFTGGVHRGCIYVLTAKGSAIKDAKDLKGKRVGVPGIGSSPWMFAQRAVGGVGLDVRRDVEWVAFPNSELQLALSRGEVDAIAVLDPTARVILNSGNFDIVVDQGVDPAYKDEYCCVIVTSGGFTRNDPETAAKITRAILKGAKWVEANPQQTATIIVEKKYVGSSIAINQQVFEHLDYIPSVIGGKEAVTTAGNALQSVNILRRNTNINKLTEATFINLPGVTDEWLNSVKVEKLEPLKTADLERYLDSIGLSLEHEHVEVADLCSTPDDADFGQKSLLSVR